MRPNYSIFLGYLKTGDVEGVSSEPPGAPLDPPRIASTDGWAGEQTDGCTRERTRPF